VKYFLCIVLFLTASSRADSFSAGVGVGMTHALLAPKVAYEFQKGIGIDMSVSYYQPDIDYCVGMYYNFKFMNEEMYLGPRLTIGERARGTSFSNFSASFVGVSLNTRGYFAKKNYVDLQVGIEGFKNSSLTTAIGFEPCAGMSYGYEFNKSTPKNRRVKELTKGLRTTLIAGNVIGGILLGSGIITACSATPFLQTPDELGAAYALFGFGIIAISVGSLDIILLDKIKYEYY